MSQGFSLERVAEMADTVSRSLGLTFVDARFGQQGRRRSLEVTIFRPGGRVSLDDCENVSVRLGELLEQSAPPAVEGPYVLEVQSPGLQRAIKTDREFSVFAGQTVEIMLKDNRPDLGQSFIGMLGEKSGTLVTIDRPRRLPAPAHKAKGSASKKTGELPACPDKIEIDLTRVIHVKLYAEDLQTRAK